MKKKYIKIAELLLVCCAIMATTFLNAQEGFCSGWEKGYHEGYCYNKNYGCYPTIPVCPIPNIGRDSYIDGYNRGFIAGQNGGSQNNSGTYNINPNNSMAGQYNVGQGEAQILNTNGYQQQYQQQNSNNNCQGNCRNGYGILTYNDGSKYSGYFKHGKPNGQGTWTSPNGNIFLGNFANNVITGKGTWVYPNGSKFESNFINGNPNGQGTWIYSDGSKYIGEVDNKLSFSGQGALSWLNGDTLVSKWLNGKQYGQGTYIFANGAKYVGEFDNNLSFNGKGIIVSNGMKYEGEWKNGKKNGHGIETFSNQTIYEGEWVNDIFMNANIELTKETEQSLKKYFDTHKLDPIEGVYKSYKNEDATTYKFGIIKSGNKFKVIIIESSLPQWQVGEVKAYCEPSSMKGIYTTKYFMGDKTSREIFASMENEAILSFDLNNKTDIFKYIKIYPLHQK
jgi:hypothetical protein